MKLDIDGQRVSIGVLTEDDVRTAHFQYGIYSIGYEARSRFVIESLAKRTERRFGVDLGGSGIGSYQKSKIASEGRGDAQVPKEALSLRQGRTWLGKISAGARVFIDVSSMDRHTMSLVIFHVLKSIGDSSADVHFVYAPAQFSPPPETQLPLESSSPVNALLAGRPREPRTPTIVLVGVGYEIGLALGVVEMFEPAHVVAYVPRGSDKQFDTEVDRVNAPLFMEQRYVTKVEYSVGSPAATFIDLKERVFSLGSEARLVLVPLGPKIFSAMCLLLGYLCSPDVAVWRLSTQLDVGKADREADGKIVGFTLKIKEVVVAT
jgi:hypothetical protein